MDIPEKARLTEEEIERAYEKGFDVKVQARNLTEEIEKKRFEGRKFVAKTQLEKAIPIITKQAREEERKRLTEWTENYVPITRHKAKSILGRKVLALVMPEYTEEQWQALSEGRDPSQEDGG